MTLIIKRNLLNGLGMWLNGLSLAGRDSRVRTKFVEVLAAEVKEMELTRIEMLKKYANKDEEGNLIVTDKEDGTKHYEIPDQEDVKKFVAEYAEYVNETVSFKDVTEQIKSIVLDTTEKIDSSIASQYSLWCEAFEATN